MLGLGVSKCLLGACLCLAALNTANNLAEAIERRDHDTSTIFIMVTAAPATVTVNPLDPTITRDAGWTVTAGPGPLVSTITSSCITYQYLLPPEDHTPPVATYTYTTRSTVTVSDTDRPITTQTTFYTPTVTVSTPRGTYLSYYCLSTLVVSYADYPGAVWTWSQYTALKTTTAVCLTSSTRSTTIPGVTLPATTRTLEDWEYLTSTSLATKYSAAVISTTVITFSGTSTTTICNNPSPTVTTTVHVTRQPTTTTVYSLLSYDSACSTRLGGPGITPRQEIARTPVEVHTVVYETVTVIDNTIRTLTGTAVVDVLTAEFPRTQIAYLTTTGTGVATYTSWVCTLPSSAV